MTHGSAPAPAPDQHPQHDQHTAPRRPAPQFGAVLEPGQQAPAWEPSLTPRLSRPARAVSAASVWRGTLLALLVVPVGVLLWLVIWDTGWVTSLVAYGAAVGTGKLYALGSGGRVTWAGAVVVTTITLVTLIAAFVGGVWLDAVRFLGGSPLEQVFDSEPWGLLAYNVQYYRPFFDGLYAQLAISAGMGGLGCFFALRGLFRGAGR